MQGTEVCAFIQPLGILYTHGILCLAHVKTHKTWPFSYSSLSLRDPAVFRRRTVSAISDVMQDSRASYQYLFVSSIMMPPIFDAIFRDDAGLYAVWSLLVRYSSRFRMQATSGIIRTAQVWYVAHPAGTSLVCIYVVTHGTNTPALPARRRPDHRFQLSTGGRTRELHVRGRRL